MINKLIFAAALAIAPLALAGESSAGDCYYGGYRGHGALARPVVRHHGHAGYHHYRGGYGVPAHGFHGGHHRHGYHSRYRGYGGYGGRYYGGYGGRYYGGGSAIGINRGGVSLYFGF